jgi:hypothetical protein
MHDKDSCLHSLQLVKLHFHLIISRNRRDDASVWDVCVSVLESIHKIGYNASTKVRILIDKYDLAPVEVLDQRSYRRDLRGIIQGSANKILGLVS